MRNQNLAPGADYDLLAADIGLSLAWSAAGGKRLSLSADYTRSIIRSDILYVAPSRLGRECPYYRKRAHSGTALMDLRLSGARGVQPKVSFGGSLFTSSGSRLARYY